VGVGLEVAVWVVGITVGVGVAEVVVVVAGTGGVVAWVVTAAGTDELEGVAIPLLEQPTSKIFRLSMKAAMTTIRITELLFFNCFNHVIFYKPFRPGRQAPF
jgi:hypothetical protein